MSDYVPNDDWDSVRRNFERLFQMFDTGGESVGVRFGLGTDAWPGGADTSTGVTITHGLGREPVAVFTQSTTLVAHCRPTAVDSTGFTATHKTIDGSSPGAGNANFYWMAVG